jgi:hypothetical protein
MTITDLQRWREADREARKPRTPDWFQEPADRWPPAVDRASVPPLVLAWYDREMKRRIDANRAS